MSATVFILGEVEGALQALSGESGLRVVAGDSSEATRERLMAMQPEIVVLVEGEGLAARGPAADGLALAREVRGRLALTARVVVVGGARTTMRAAIEAGDLGGVRVLRRPVEGSTLRFAVQSSLAEGRFAPQAPLRVSSALPGLPTQDVGARAPAPGERRQTLPPVSRSGIGSAQAAAALAKAESMLAGAAADMTIVGAAAGGQPPAMPAGPGPLPASAATFAGTAFSGSPPPMPEHLGSEAPGSAASLSRLDDLWPDPDGDELPLWRERTQVLGAPEPEPEPVSPTSSAPDGPPSHDHLEVGGGTFARELRRTLSAIERRLFPNERTSALDTPGDDVIHSDIDLDSFGMDTIPGIDTEPTPPIACAGAATPGPGERGNVSNEDAAFLLARLHRSRFTGRVTFRRDDQDQVQEKTVYLDDGRPVFAASSTQHDRMGELLMREGKITRAQLDRAQALVVETGRRMGEILVDMGFLKARELYPAVRRHVEDIIYSLFSWTEGQHVVIASPALPGERIRVSIHPAQLLFEGVRRKVGKLRLTARIGGPTAVVEPQPGAAAALLDADLSAGERRAFDLCDGTRTLAEVAVQSGLGEVAALQLAYALVALDAARSKPGGAAEPETAGMLGLARESEIGIDRERVRAKYAHVAEADYFTVLGVRPDATAFEVRRAYETARRDYGPGGLSPELLAELGPEIDEIALVVHEAYRVLSDDRVRAAYLVHLAPL